MNLMYFSAVPLRTPELTLTSHSSTDIQVSWQPLPAKVSRGRMMAYRLSYRTATDDTVTNVELPHNSTEYHLEGLQPDTIYLLRMAAATRVGWCEPSAWTSHRTPKISSNKGKPARAWEQSTVMNFENRKWWIFFFFSSIIWFKHLVNRNKNCFLFVFLCFGHILFCCCWIIRRFPRVHAVCLLWY